MGAYENPIQAIDDKSGMIIANAISNVGQQTAQFIHRYYDDQNKELEKARKEEENRLAALEKNKDKLHASIENAGGRSQSIFDIADLAINTKYDYEGKLKNATTDEERIEYTREINKQKSIIRTLTQGIADIDDWKKTNGQRVMDQNTNDPGGIYTGSCSEDSSEFNKKICQDYTRKQAIMGTLTKDGNLVQGIKYHIKFEEVDGVEVPSLWATIPGGDSGGFHVSNTLINDYAEVENVFKGPDGINAKTKEMGLETRGVYGAAYVQKPLEVFTKTQDGQDVSRWIQPLNTEAIVNTLKPEYQTHYLSMVDSIDNEADYNDLVATYLSYVKNGKALETVKPGVWKLTAEAKERFVHDMVQISLTDKIPSYQTINAIREGDEVIYLDADGNEVRTTENENWIYDKKTGKVIGRADAQKEMEKGNIGEWGKVKKDETSQRNPYDIQAENSVNLLMTNPQDFISKEGLDTINEDVKMAVIDDPKKGKGIKVTTISDYLDDNDQPIENVKEYYTSNKYDAAAFLKKYLWSGTTKQDNQLKQFGDIHISQVLGERAALAEEIKKKDKEAKNKFPKMTSNWKKWKLNNAKRYMSPEKLKEWKGKYPNKDFSSFVEIPTNFLPYVIAEERGIEMSFENLKKINKELFEAKKEN